MAPLPFLGGLFAGLLPVRPCGTDLSFEPSRSLRADSERPGEVGKGGSGSQEVHCQHPMPERQARAVHRRSCPHGKVLPARRAAVWRGPFVRNRGRSRAPAFGATPDPPPADALQPEARGLFVLIGLRPARHPRPPARASSRSDDVAGSLAKGHEMPSPDTTAPAVPSRRFRQFLRPGNGCAKLRSLAPRRRR